MISYYVYYRVPADRRAPLRPQIEEVFRAIEQATGVRGRWMRRRDDPGTYMEVYENVADSASFEALLQRASAPLGLERHVERFTCA